jgi:hypothetical protein
VTGPKGRIGKGNLRDIETILDSPAMGCILATTVIAPPALAQQMSAETALAIETPRTAVEVGRFEATRPMRILVEPDFATRALGDTFDSEVLVADSPAINEFAWVSAVPGGQSLLSDGFFQPAGVSQLNGAPVEAGVAEFDNGDGTRTIVVTTRIDPFSDGFLPLGFTFSPSGNPIDTIGWLFGDTADRDGSPTRTTLSSPAISRLSASSPSSTRTSSSSIMASCWDRASSAGSH